MPEGRWLVWVSGNPFYDPLKDLASSEDHREKLQLTLQKKDPYVSFWFSKKEILERVFGEKKKNNKD